MLVGMRIIVGWSIRLLLIQHTAFTAEALELSLSYSYLNYSNLVYTVNKSHPKILMALCGWRICVCMDEVFGVEDQI